MARGTIAALWLAMLVSPLTGATPPPSAGRLTQAERFDIIRDLVAVVAIARQPLPSSSQGIIIAPDGKLLNPGNVISSLQSHPPGARIGDRVAITSIAFQGNSLVFELNGGPVKTHWYDHLSMGMGGALQPVVPLRRAQTPGAQITLRFPGHPPALTPAAVQQDLSPLIAWGPPATAVEMVKPLPPPVKAAIARHQALVGMTPGMVIAALGRTNNKSRNTDPHTGATYEDWVYGAPPANTVFVRLENGRVIRVTTYFPHGGHTTDTTPIPALAAAMAANVPAASPGASDANYRPTLRRPGDAAPTLGARMPPTMSPSPGPMQSPGLPGLGYPPLPGGLPSNPGAPGPPSSPGGY